MNSMIQMQKALPASHKKRVALKPNSKYIHSDDW
jgi:hypothetical protein